MQSALVSLHVIAAVTAGTAQAPASQPFSWAGAGSHRLLVRVAPLDVGGRGRDEMPAELVVNWPTTLREHGIDGKADVAAIQVIRHDPVSGRPVKSTGYAYGRSPHDLPFRWYDGSIPYDFPEMAIDISRTRGKLRRVRSPRAGYFYAALGDWRRGHLAWTHTQRRNEPALYAIYFDVMPVDEQPANAPPRAWLGDAMPRFDVVPTTSTGTGHTRIAVDDWDANGAPDILFGESYGCVFWLPNLGAAARPEFRFYKMLRDADGLPIDVGLSAAPLVADWDGDGVKDLLVGTHWNRLAFFRNRGTNGDRQLAYEGIVHIDGAPLELPFSPVVGRPAGIFKRDYYPVLEMADWNGDGRPDLLAGGYVTGRVYLYENTGRDPSGRPRLTSRGPLEADGRPLNVGDWCAAPTVADFDSDGDLDLISGRMPMSPAGHRDPAPLRYYENTGAATAPQLRQRPFPSKGAPRLHTLTSPRAVDWNADGRIDLVVSAHGEICLYENVGTATRPMFDLTAKPLRPAWGSATLSVDQFLDWDGDGRVDVVSGYMVMLNDGVGNPYRFGRRTVQVLPDGQHIAHPSGYGDDWFWPRLHDFDRDGRVDVLFGDWWGRVWFHRNQSKGDEKAFDLTGRPFKLVTGKELMVGPKQKDPTKDFTALQGARTVFAMADFDRDGLNDLVVGDTHGIIRYYRNAGTRAQPVFAEPVVVGDQRIRLLVDAADWNGDGWPDVVAGAANGTVRVYLNARGRGKTPFDAGLDPGLPPIKQPRVMMVDLNADGDEDLFLPSTQGSVFIERSFLRHGYARAQLLAVQTRPD